MTVTESISPGLDEATNPTPHHPVVARMYDWYLDGTHNYAIDRKAAEDVERALPDIKPVAIENRAFLRRAVRWLSKQGIDQFIDMGSGLPTAGNTHETVLKVNPKAKILYVDIEGTVVTEGREFIKKTGWQNQAGMLRASALEPASILNNPETRRVIDFSRPVAIMMIALIHFFESSQIVPVLDFWKENLVKGSAFVMTHCTTDDRDPVELARTTEVYARTPTPVLFRPRTEIEPFMDGWAVAEPGMVRAHMWKMEEMNAGEEEPPKTLIWFVAVGFLV